MQVKKVHGLQELSERLEKNRRYFEWNLNFFHVIWRTCLIYCIHSK